MMRFLLSILLLLVACGPGADRPVGRRVLAVGVDDCREPYQTWIREAAQSAGWYVAPNGRPTIHCTDTGTDGGVGEYLLGTDVLLFDPEKASKASVIEFETKGVCLHEIGHWLIANGPHPEMAKLHLCTWAYNDPVPPGCYPHIATPRAVMSPLGTRHWDGDQEDLSLDKIPPAEYLPEDVEFIDKATTP